MTDADLAQYVSEPLLGWFDQYGRHDFPWKHPGSAYRIWISEIMLQQTQVQTVIPYFERFVHSFPDIQQLAGASEDQVLAHWSGLGYYSRARNIHKTAQIICSQYQGQFPDQLTDLLRLPGIGESTAAAIASQAFHQPTAILDGNVKRVLSRYFMVDGPPGQAAVKKRLWQLAQACMSQTRCADYTQAIMDLGATCCTLSRPRCDQCPLRTHCRAHAQQRVSDYPVKQVKPPRPTRQEQFLLLHSDDRRIYLERRASPGLWGGLWCLPNIEQSCDPLQHIQQQYGLNCLDARELMSIKHSFSHFHLRILARAFQVQPDDMRNASGQWFALSELAGVGLAKPVNQIIRCFSGKQNGL